MIDPRSERNLKGVHPDLVKVVLRAMKTAPGTFVITEGLRTLARQKQLLAAGASTTLKSRHLTGHAVDVAALVDGKIRWDWPLYARIATVMKDAANDLGVSLEWGGDWKKFKDGPHFQLPWKVYA